MPGIPCIRPILDNIATILKTKYERESQYNGNKSREDGSTANPRNAVYQTQAYVRHWTIATSILINNEWLVDDRMIIKV
jgi:hypothetical protein